MATSTLLQARLRPVPTEGGFVKKLLWWKLFKSSAGDFQDALTWSPVEDTLDELIENLSRLLLDEEPDIEKILELLTLVQGEYKNPYQRPAQQNLANGAKPVVTNFLESGDNLVVENVSQKSLLVHPNKLWQSMVDVQATVKSKQLSFILTKYDSVLISKPSFFVIFAPGIAMSTRMNLMEQLLYLQEILLASGIFDDKQNRQEVLKFCRTLKPVSCDSKGCQN